jgi:hypothetical protein
MSDDPPSGKGYPDFLISESDASGCPLQGAYNKNPARKNRTGLRKSNM